MEKGRTKVFTGSRLSRPKGTFELLSNHSDLMKLTESAPAEPHRGERSLCDGSNFLGLGTLLEVPNVPALLVLTLIHAVITVPQLCTGSYFPLMPQKKRPYPQIVPGANVPEVFCPSSHAFLQTVVIGFGETFPLWVLSSHGAGGLEWSSMEIG